MSLTYFPVVTRYDQNIFENNLHCFINPVWSPPTPEMLQKLSVYPYLLCDNGAYEMFKIMNRNRNGKKMERFFVIPGGGIYQNKDGLHLDPFELCKTFGRLKVRCGFTLDYPLVNGSVEEYSDHLYKSFEKAETMFDLQTKFCPETDLLIPLHFSTKDQLHDYFNNMSVLGPDGYAFPVRERTTRGYLMRIAYTLTFLHSKGIKRVHLLGSSKPEIIIICAAALGLGMFDHITFDSSTWRTTRNLIAKILDPETFKQKDIRDLEDFSALLPKELAQQWIDHTKEFSKSELNKLIILSNVLTINRHTQKRLELAKDIEALISFVQEPQNLNSEIAMTIDAIGLLQVGSLRGYRSVENIYDYIWPV